MRSLISSAEPTVPLVPRPARRNNLRCTVPDKHATAHVEDTCIHLLFYQPIFCFVFLFFLCAFAKHPGPFYLAQLLHLQPKLKAVPASFWPMADQRLLDMYPLSGLRLDSSANCRHRERRQNNTLRHDPTSPTAPLNLAGTRCLSHSAVRCPFSTCAYTSYCHSGAPGLTAA